MTKIVTPEIHVIYFCIQGNILFHKKTMAKVSSVTFLSFILYFPTQFL